MALQRQVTVNAALSPRLLMQDPNDIGTPLAELPMGAQLVRVEPDGSRALEKARGCMLGLMIGDALGAAVEGWPQDNIRELAKSVWGREMVEDYIEAVHMGTYVPGNECGTYRVALAVSDQNFVASGPPRNREHASRLKEAGCLRFGRYTDDANSCLAVARSIAECSRVDTCHVAQSCAKLFLNDNKVYRGCPPTAKQVMVNTLAGMSPAETGLPPNFPFAGGSFANGGAMRISPVAIAYRNADAATLRNAVAATIFASHRHPEAIDFAVVQAAAVQYAFRMTPSEFDRRQLLEELADMCETTDMASAIREISRSMEKFNNGGDEHAVVGRVVDMRRRPGSGMGFQIASIHMAPCVLWAACFHYADPRKAIQTAIDLGGDTDTTASMVGAIVGALHGEGAWCQHWAASLENEEYGRDYALKLAESLSCLDLATEEEVD